MKPIPHDVELDRLMDERDHLRIKLSMTRDSGTQDVDLINRLERSVSIVEEGIVRHRKKHDRHAGMTP